MKHANPHPNPTPTDPWIAAIDTILYEHDLIGIAWVDRHEYDIEAAMIAEQLVENMDEPELAVVVYWVFRRQFEHLPLPVVDDAVWQEIAAEIMVAVWPPKPKDG
jgi:hypothetical protein